MSNKPTKIISKKIWEMNYEERMKEAYKLMKNYRDGKVAKILANEWLNEVVHTEADLIKREISMLNRMMKLNNYDVDVEVELTEEDLLEREDLDIGNIDDIFNTQE